MIVGVIRIAIGSIILASCGLALRADQVPQPEESWQLIRSDETTAELERRDAELTQELDSGTAPEWAGDYRSGDGLGKNVRVVLAPDGGFIYTWYGCMGRYDANYGTIRERAGRLQLDPEMPMATSGFAGLHAAYLRVPWGERRYLIAPEEMQAFANAVNAGFEPCRHMCPGFLMKEGDSEIEVTGSPSLPPEYEHLLLRKPIQANLLQILEVTHLPDPHPMPDYEVGTRITKVVIDAGLKAGVHRGMSFFVADPEAGGAEYLIDSVGSDSSIATSKTWVFPDLNADVPLARAGMGMTTRAPVTGDDPFDQ